MDNSLTFGRVFGIPLKLHYSWFLVLLLIVWSLATGYFPQEYPGWTRVSYWWIGVITSVFFFGSVLIHELGHSIIALREKVPVRSITLFIFGGLAQIGHDPDTAGTEFRIAIAGPITSLLLAGSFFLGALITPISEELGASARYLARINLLLATFNMIPGFPLDGGRVLRAILWKFGRSFYKATRWASYVGQGIALLFIVYGVFSMFRGGFLNGLWIAFIGFFLNNAAETSFRQVSVRESLIGISAEQIMSDRFMIVSLHMPLADLVNAHVLGRGDRCFFVIEHGRLLGMLTLHSIKAVARESWSTLTTGDVMIPLDQLLSVGPKEDAWTILRKMDEADINQVPVMEKETLLGVITREHLLHYLRARSELGV